MESLIQFTLILKKTHPNEIKGDVIYLKSRPELGFGQIKGISEERLTYFSLIRSRIGIDQSIQIFNTFLPPTLSFSERILSFLNESFFKSDGVKANSCI